MDEDLKQPDNKDLKVLRTYTSDMADVIRDNEISVIKIALAEKEKREQEAVYEKAEGTKSSKVFLVIGGILLILIAIVVSYFLIQKKKAAEIPPVVISNIETFISYDSSSYIDVTNATNMSDLSGIISGEKSISTGLIKALFLTKKVDGISRTLTSSEFLSLIESTTPETLIRSLSDKYLLGEYPKAQIVNEKNKPAMFLILQTTDYNRAYASMLEWEKTMLKDLFVLFDIDIPNSDNSIFEKSWKDIIINNKDARVLYGENGEETLYYVFANRNDLIITNNMSALKEILERIILKNAKPL